MFNSNSNQINLIQPRILFLVPVLTGPLNGAPHFSIHGWITTVGAMVGAMV